MANGIKEFPVFIEPNTGVVPTVYALQEKYSFHIFEFKIILVQLEHDFLLSKSVPAYHAFSLRLGRCVNSYSLSCVICFACVMFIVSACL